MAMRGPDGIQGGPIRLHHDFWSRFLRQAIDSLRLPREEQMSLVAAIALPLGRVTRIWVDDEGTTYWRGTLSQANPIARIIWQMLQEGLIHLGVSVGGKIWETQDGGRDALGRPCTLITDIRLDELSITDSPALRLTQGEGTGAYITALAKSIRSALTPPPRKMTTSPQQVERFLQKSLALSLTDLNLGFDRDNVGPPRARSPKGSQTVQMNTDQPKTGMGEKPSAAKRPKAKGNEPKTDVYGFTVKELTAELRKCAGYKTPGQWSDPATLQLLTDGSFGLTSIDLGGNPPPVELVNMVKFLQYLNQFAQGAQYMHPYQGNATAIAMGEELSKALDNFEEKMPSDLVAKPLRPPGSPGVAGMHIEFPQQYVLY